MERRDLPAQNSRSSPAGCKDSEYARASKAFEGMARLPEQRQRDVRTANAREYQSLERSIPQRHVQAPGYTTVPGTRVDNRSMFISRQHAVEKGSGSKSNTTTSEHVARRNECRA